MLNRKNNFSSKDSSCKLYLPFDGIDNQTIIVDQSTSKHVVTAASGAKIQAAKVGSGCLFLDGNSDYLTVPNSSDFAYGTTPFTLECWFKPAVNNTPQFIYDHRSSADAEQYSNTFWYGGNYGYINFSGTRAPSYTVSYDYTYNITLTANQWYHFAITRNGASLLLFIDGVLTTWSTVGTAISAGTSFPTITDRALRIGAYAGGGYYANGCLDDFHVTKSAKYSTTFTPAPVVVDANTKLLLKFDQPDGTANTILDRSTKGHVISVAGSAAITHTDAKYGSGCLAVNGSTDYLTVQRSTIFDLGNDYTIEGWFNATDGTQGYVFGIYGSTGTDRCFFQMDTGYLYYRDSVVDGAHWNVVTYSYSFGVWYHFAMVRNNGILVLYVNGIAQTVGSVVGSGSPTSSFGTIVGGYDDGGIAHPFKGKIDDFHISNVARYSSTFTPSKVNPDTNTLLYLPFDLIEDSSASNHAITAVNTARVLAPKMGSGCLTLNGTSDYVTIADSLDFAYGTGPFTIRFWLKTRSIAGNDNQTIYDHRTSSPNSIVYITYYNSTDQLIFRVRDNGTTLADYYLNWTPILDVWYHVELVRNGDSLLVFINGTSQTWSTVDTAISVSTSFPDIGADVNIGRYNGNSEFLNGCIDDFSIHNIALHAANFTPDPTPYNITAIDRAYYYKANSVLKLHCDNIVTDYSSNRLPITMVNSAITSIFSPKIGNGCLSLNVATTDYLTTPNSSVLNLGNYFTIEFWIKGSYFESIDGDTKWMYTLGKTDSDASNRWWFELSHGGAGYGVGKWRIVFASTTGGSSNYDVRYDVASYFSITSNIWHHIAIVRDNTSWYIYFDGASLPLSLIGGSSSGTVNVNSYPLAIGNYGTSSIYSYDGQMDELRISDSVRYPDGTTFSPSTTEFANDSNTKLLLHFDAIKDYSDEVRTITVHGNALITTTNPKLGTGCVSFDGEITSYLEISASPKMNLGTKDWTLEFWFNTSDLSHLNGLYHCGADALRPSMYARVNTDGTLATRFVDSTENVCQQIDPATVCSINTWYHFAHVHYEQVSYLYLNGVQIGSSSGAIEAVDLSSYPLLIGRTSPNYTQPFEGTMDEINTSNYAKYLTNFVPNARGAF